MIILYILVGKDHHSEPMNLPMETLAASKMASHLVESMTISSSGSNLSSVRFFLEPMNRTTYTHHTHSQQSHHHNLSLTLA